MEVLVGRWNTCFNWILWQVYYSETWELDYFLCFTHAPGPAFLCTTAGHKT